MLVLCTGNSCRSQMAEAFLRRAAGQTVEVASAGAEPSGFVHPMAVEVMREAGFDLSSARSKPISEFLDRRMVAVITVCDRAEAACPPFPGQPRQYHWAFDDPAESTGRDGDVRRVFRRIRDEIGRVFTAYGCGLADRGAASPADALLPES